MTYLVGHIGKFVLHVGQRLLDEGRHVVDVFWIISWDAFLRHFRHDVNLKIRITIFWFCHEEGYRVFTSVVSVKLHFFHVFSEIRGMSINKQVVLS